MIILNDQQIAQCLPQLEADLPRSLPVFHLMRNTLRQQFAWPGLEFVVDAFPNVSVCLCRPESTGRNYVPVMNGYTVFVYSRNADILQRMLFVERAVDWTQPIMFADVTEPEHAVLLEEGKNLPDGRFDQLVFRPGFPEGALAYQFDLPKLDLTYEVPAGFRLGTLAPEHAAQISRDRQYGNEENNTTYFRYLIEHGFPTAAAFEEKDPSTPVAYVLFKPEGVLGAAYVRPDLRNNGLIRVVACELLRQLRDLGQVWVWGDVMKFNRASQKAAEAIGGVLIPGLDIHWIGYLPASDNRQIKVEYHV